MRLLYWRKHPHHSCGGGVEDYFVSSSSSVTLFFILFFSPALHRRQPSTIVGGVRGWGWGSPFRRLIRQQQEQRSLDALSIHRRTISTSTPPKRSSLRMESFVEWREQQQLQQQPPQPQSHQVMRFSSTATSLSSPSSVRLCPKCHGEGKLWKPLSRKARLRHQRKKLAPSTTTSTTTTTLLGENNDNQEASTNNSSSLVLPRHRWDPCPRCTQQSGLLWEDNDDDDAAKTTNLPSSPQPLHVAIVGGGIGGLALAVALQHRHISFHVYEKDQYFAQRRQGYGLTLQQARSALLALGVQDQWYFHRRHRSGGGGARTEVKMDETELPTNLCFFNGDAITSTKHVVHTIDGTIVGEWGLRKWAGSLGNNNNNNNYNNNNSTSISVDKKTKPSKRQNLHLPRQTLRYALWEALRDACNSRSRNTQQDNMASSSSSSSNESMPISWDHKLVNIEPVSLLDDHLEPSSKMRLTFHVSNNDDGSKRVTTTEADLVVGCDGIRSTVRKVLLGCEPDQNGPITTTPLRYLDCIVILGICRLDLLDPTIRQSPLLDGETVFQTADGTTRIYLMPYSKRSEEYMWQLSFPLPEDVAKTWSNQGSAALKQEALNKCQTWHQPIPEILRQTPVDLVSGYPVYDRDLLDPDTLQKARDGDSTKYAITLLGDACHPMSPFKGQGANQALLDALSLARSLYRIHVRDGKSIGLALQDFEHEMIERSSKKVKASSDAAQFLHSEIAISSGDVTRGGAAAAAAAAAKTPQ
jgi:salicylate hydroxylase